MRLLLHVILQTNMAAKTVPVLAPTDDDVQKMLACKVHIGTRNLDYQMTNYCWKRRTDGTYLMNLGKTWEKLMLAARVIVAIENPADVVVVSARAFGQRACLKYGKYTGAETIVGRFTPGTFTNHVQKKFLEPRVLIVTDPLTDHQALNEAAKVNIPTIAFCNSDTNLRNVDIAIPCNNRGRLSIGLLYWLLAREVRRMRGLLDRAAPWDVMVDLFFYVDPEEQEQREAAAAASAAAPAAAAPAATSADYAADGAGPEWGGEQNWPAAQNEWPAGRPAAADGPWVSTTGDSQWVAQPNSFPNQW